MSEITQLLQQLQAGDASARDALFAAAYPVLEKLARARLRDGGRSTLLDTRGLVHDSYLRYVRDGALLNFLSGLGAAWNIMLFHYRNHGAAGGRVLAGFEGSKRDRSRLLADLRRTGYRFWEETDNPAFRLFLR